MRNRWYCSIGLFIVIMLIAIPKVGAHYNTHGILINAADCYYFYHDPAPGYGSVIPLSWRPFIGLAALDWTSQSSQVNMNSTIDRERAGNYVFRSNRISEIACLEYWIQNGVIYNWNMAFNENENFYSDGRKYDVRTVALHEFGHALGIDHVGFSLLPDTRAHIMYYTYTQAKPLHPHDSEAVISIYGS